MEVLASSVLRNLQLVKADLMLLTQLDDPKKVLRPSLHYAVKLFEEITISLQNELVVIQDRCVSHYLNLLRLELTDNCHDWVVSESTPGSIKLLNKVGAELNTDNAIIIEVLPDTSGKLLSFLITQQNENLKLKFETDSGVFVAYVMYLLKAFLPSSVAIHNLNLPTSLSIIKEEILASETTGLTLIDTETATTVKVEHHDSITSMHYSDDHKDYTSYKSREDDFDDIPDRIMNATSVKENCPPLKEHSSAPTYASVVPTTTALHRNHELKCTRNRKIELSLPCHICKKVLSTFTQAAKHWSKGHGFKGFGCCYCPNKIFTSKQDMRTHFNIYHHPGKNLLMCTLPCKDCKIPLGRNQACDHMRIEHGQPHVCPFCNFSANNMDLSSINNLFVDCATTGGLSDSEQMERLKHHIIAAHRLETAKGWRCGCHKTFPTKELLQEHENKHNQKNERIRHCKLASCRNEKLVCGHCGLSFAKRYLARHAAKEHGIDMEGKYKYVCKYCSKRFGAPYRLKTHLIQEHFPEKKEYVCSVCQKSFCLPNYLDEHMKRHSAISIKCSQCPKVFKCFANVRQHLRGCHFPPAFQCLVCVNKYHHKAMLRTHLKKAHKIADTDSDKHMLKHKIDIMTEMALVRKLWVSRP